MANKDRISLYMFRNVLATLFITFVSFMMSLMFFYHCSFIEALKRLFIYDLYTTLYFLLVWVFNYIVFEISKIIYDIYEEKVTFFPSIVLLIIGLGVYILPMISVFQYNISLLCLLIIMRMVKEMWKRSPQLFSWIKKRPDAGLK